MGRKGSKLIPFLMDALKSRKYNNLKFENFSTNTFSLLLPQNTTRLAADCQFILMDWYKVKNRPYKLKKDYTEAKQGMEAALRKSDFLEVVCKGRNTKLIYRILTQNEVQAKKSLKKAQKKAFKSDPYADLESAPSPESSGYGSGSDSNEIFEGDGNHALLHAFNHDHEYSWNMGQASSNESLLLNNIGNEGLIFHDNALPFEQNCIGNLGIYSLLDNIFPDEIDSSVTEDPLVNEINLNETFDADDSFMLNLDSLNVNNVIEDLGEELFTDSEEYSVNWKISTISGLDIVSSEAKKVKVYECLHQQNMPDMIMLTCEPKCKEFCMADIYENDSMLPSVQSVGQNFEETPQNLKLEDFPQIPVSQGCLTTLTQTPISTEQSFKRSNTKDKMVEVLRESNSLLQHQPVDECEDIAFLLSCFYHVSALPTNKKFNVKKEILKLLEDARQRTKAIFM